MPRSRHRRWAWALGALLLYKTLYVLAYVDLPFLYGGIGDSQVYLGQSAALASGQYSDPRLIAFSPLYGVFLHLLDARAAPLFAVVLQLLMGLASAGLIARMLHRRVAPRAGWIAAGLYVTYAVFMYYESKVLSETLGIFLLSVGLTLFDRLQDRLQDRPQDRLQERLQNRAQLGVAALAGLAFGACTLARASFLFCLPPLILAVIFFDGGWARRARVALLLSMGMAAPLVANGLKTWSMTGHFIPVVMVSSTVEKTTAQAWNGLANLDPTHDAAPSDVVREAAGRLASDAPMPSPHIDWIGFVKGAPGKIVQAFSLNEHTYQYGYYGERAAITALRLLPGSFAFIALLGLLGLGLGLGGRLSRPLLLTAGPIIVGTLGMMCLFHPSSRYRLPMTLGLLMLAAGACSVLWESPRRQRAMRCALVALFVGFGALQIAHLPTAPAEWHFALAQSHVAAGDVVSAEAEARTALHWAPDDVELRRRIRTHLGRAGRRAIDAERR